MSYVLSDIKRGYKIKTIMKDMTYQWTLVLYEDNQWISMNKRRGIFFAEIKEF